MNKKILMVKYMDENGMTTYLTLPHGIILDFFYENDPLSLTIYVGDPANKEIGFLITTTLYIEPSNPFAQIFLEKSEHEFGVKAEEFAQEQFSLKVEEVLRSKDKIFDLTSFLEELSGTLNDCADSYISENYNVIHDEICDKMTKWEVQSVSSDNTETRTSDNNDTNGSSNI